MDFLPKFSKEGRRKEGDSIQLVRHGMLELTAYDEYLNGWPESSAVIKKGVRHPGRPFLLKGHKPDPTIPKFGYFFKYIL